MASSGNATSISFLRWSAMSSSWLPAYDVIMTEVVRHKERFGDALRDLPPPTDDDVTILLDGTRLDTPEKTLAWIKELIARRAEAESSG